MPNLTAETVRQIALMVIALRLALPRHLVILKLEARKQVGALRNCDAANLPLIYQVGEAHPKAGFV